MGGFAAGITRWKDERGCERAAPEEGAAPWTAARGVISIEEVSHTWLTHRGGGLFPQVASDGEAYGTRQAPMLA